MLSSDPVEYIFIAILLLEAIAYLVLKRRSVDARYLTGLHVGFAATLILYGAYIGRVWPFVLVVLIVIFGRLSEKMAAQRQIQRLRDMYRRN